MPTSRHWACHDLGEDGSGREEALALAGKRLWLWQFMESVSNLDMGLSMTGGTPTWMVYNGESPSKMPPSKMDDDWGHPQFGTPPHGRWDPNLNKTS